MVRIPSINQVQPNTGRMLEEDGDVVNIADLLSRMANGETRINGKTSGTSFGADFVIATEKPDAAGKWNQGINLTTIERSIVNGAYAKITTDESTLEVHTGVQSNGGAILRSKKKLRYQPGIPGYGKFTAAFPDTSATNGDFVVGIGLLNPECGYALCKVRESDVTSYKFMLRRKSVDTYYDLNGDDLSEFDLENLNIYRIDYGYLGIDSTKIRIRDEVNNKWLMVHKQVYNQKTTNTESPNLALGAFAINKGNTTDIEIINGSFQSGTVDGGTGLDPSGRPNSQGITKTAAAAATRGLIFAFRNPVSATMIDSINSAGATTTRVFVNDIASKLQAVKASVDGIKNVLIELFITDISNITSGTFVPVEPYVSVLDVSTNAVVNLTGAKLLDAFPMSKDGSFDTDIKQDYLLYPGQVAIFVYTTTAATDLSMFIKYNDLF